MLSMASVVTRNRRRALTAGGPLGRERAHVPHKLNGGGLEADERPPSRSRGRWPAPSPGAFPRRRPRRRLARKDPDPVLGNPEVAEQQPDLGGRIGTGGVDQPVLSGQHLPRAKVLLSSC